MKESFNCAWFGVDEVFNNGRGQVELEFGLENLFVEGVPVAEF